MKELNNTQPLLKALLAIQALSLIVYTIYVGTAHGWNFLDVALTSVKSISWSGQFALDFNCYLMLSAVWIAWRNNYTLPSIIIAIIAMIMGIIVFAPYLLYLLTKEKGSIPKVLLGDRA
jgi:hypothetical protein